MLQSNPRKPLTLSLTVLGALLALVALLALAGEQKTATAAPTADPLDSSFGSNGRVTLDLGSFDYMGNVIVQPDGKILVGGRGTYSGHNYRFLVARYNGDGTLDSSFGGGGMDAPGVTTTAFPQAASAEDMARLDNGQIVLFGETTIGGITPTVALARYDANGSLDNSFGGFGGDPAGMVIHNFSGQDGVVAGTVQADGKLVVVGDVVTAGNNRDLAVFRFNADGSVDTGFGNQGLARIDLEDGEGLQDVVALPGNQLLVYGSVEAPAAGEGSNSNLVLARLDENGSLDTTFGNNGIMTTDTGYGDQPGELELLPDGRILASGAVEMANVLDTDLLLARYTAAGTPDTTFGSSGVITADLGGLESGHGLALHPEGHILVGGGHTTTSGTPQDFLLAVFTEHGALYTLFGADSPPAGATTTDFGGNDDYATDVAVDDNGRILLGGNIWDDAAGDNHIGLARYLLPDTTQLYLPLLAR